MAYDDTETQLGVNNVQDAIEKLNTNIDEQNKNLLPQEITITGSALPSNCVKAYRIGNIGVLMFSGSITRTIGGYDTLFKLDNINAKCNTYFQAMASSKVIKCYVTETGYVVLNNETEITSGTWISGSAVFILI